jgi:hypothetical protein
MRRFCPWVLLGLVLLVGCDGDHDHYEDPPPAPNSVLVELAVDDSVLADLFPERVGWLGADVHFVLVDRRSNTVIDEDYLLPGTTSFSYQFYPDRRIGLVLTSEGRWFGSLDFLNLDITGYAERIAVRFGRIADGSIVTTVNSRIVDVHWEPCGCLADG